MFKARRSSNDGWPQYLEADAREGQFMAKSGCHLARRCPRPSRKNAAMHLRSRQILQALPRTKPTRRYAPITSLTRPSNTPISNGFVITDIPGAS